MHYKLFAFARPADLCELKRDLLINFLGEWGLQDSTFYMHVTSVLFRPQPNVPIHHSNSFVF
jgi:hypothetical protein